MSKLEASLGPEHDFRITLREGGWIPQTVEHVKVFPSDHQAIAGAAGTVSVYLVKTVVDVFKDWAIDRLKRAPQNTEKLTVYGPDNKAPKTITLKAGSIDE